MGWTSSTRWYNKSVLIQDRIKGEEAFKCIAHQCKGNVLWTVWEITQQRGEHPAGTRFIGCDLLRKFPRGDGWGYKDMCESSHPYQYSCPLKYLDMVPVASEKWREGVRAYWDHRKYVSSLKPGDYVKMKDGITPNEFKIVSAKPLRGTALSTGILYRLKADQIKPIKQAEMITA